MSSRVEGDEALGIISRLRFNYDLTCKEYSILTSFLGGRSLWKAALFFFEDMKESQVSPDSVAYTAAISACRRVKRWQHSLVLLEDMKESQVLPTLPSLNAVISACGQSGQWQHALMTFQTMKDYAVSPDQWSLNGALEAAACGEQWALAIQLLAALHSLRLEAQAGAVGEICSKVWFWGLVASPGVPTRNESRLYCRSRQC
ncbi:PTAC2 [Symbiodinium sp. CCMP2592]|nr:PTAC2 [Symbiodinium sp. CCMP2592]